MGQSGIIALLVNGKSCTLKGPTALKQFLREYGIDTQFVAIAYNGMVLEKGEFDKIILNDGDTVEIVRPVGGG